MSMKAVMLGEIQRMDMEMEVVETKLFKSSVGVRREEKGTPLYAGKSHYVDENKWCKNVRFRVCHYVDENKAT